MVDYGIVRSTVKPEEKVIDEFSVWVNTDISEIEVLHEDDTHTEFEYHQVQYSKEEYIKLIDAKNADLEQELTNTQLALCDVYEMLG
jgi:hypothetical protein